METSYKNIKKPYKPQKSEQQCVYTVLYTQKGQG